ncbi:hypothetical protein DSL72_000413 [Monilinia vaccinii-corymbosi]|uniref:Uncharacterized protein n=1 Tax=Monilinia vaccinii-corymbosi TaxID=61207 RepID=A0A8A3NYV9_9HELO|nr:hypothetical protein DSL72_000413 [Monilinia vaccinii-corymbosi]
MSAGSFTVSNAIKAFRSHPKDNDDDDH